MSNDLLDTKLNVRNTRILKSLDIFLQQTLKLTKK